MSSASGWDGVSTQDALAGAVAFTAAMRAEQDSSGKDATDLARDVLDAIAKWNTEPDAPPHLAHEWGCLTEAERADVLAWAAAPARHRVIRNVPGEGIYVRPSETDHGECLICHPAAPAGSLRALAADAERELHFATVEDNQRYRPLVRAWLESRAQALDEGEARPVVHAVPPAGSGLTPCCRRPPFELAHDDRMTWEVSVVTCGGHATEADRG